ncbi:unnamed protein product [Linum trigynum]|uniref:Uncharacterized protein n=1 Tax=Linum trigynum TaxID=586398 RepID=A0AAV2G1C4_9ROSI
MTAVGSFWQRSLPPTKAMGDGPNNHQEERVGANLATQMEGNNEGKRSRLRPFLVGPNSISSSYVIKLQERLQVERAAGEVT